MHIQDKINVLLNLQNKCFIKLPICLSSSSTFFSFFLEEPICHLDLSFYVFYRVKQKRLGLHVIEYIYVFFVKFTCVNYEGE